MSDMPRVLYNQDCTNVFSVTPEPITPAHLDRMVSEVADAGADAFLVNPNAQKVNYPSDVWERFWDGYRSDPTVALAALPEGRHQSMAHLFEQMARLAETGHDYMACVTASCRRRGIAPWVTVRMNDQHDAPCPGSPLQCRLWLDHPEYRVNGPAHWGWSAAGFNYAVPQVRAYYLILIDELLDRYDLDGIELDYLRFTGHFPAGEHEQHLDTMTGFVAEVRQRTEAKAARDGHPVALAVRVAPTLAACREMGLDVAQWARHARIDALTAGHFLHNAWEVPFGEFRETLGPDVALYGATEFSSQGRRAQVASARPMTPEMFRALVAGWLAAGADGANLFNFFCYREGSRPGNPPWVVVRDLRSRETLAGKPKLYMVSRGGSMTTVDLPFQVPVSVPPGVNRGFDLLLASEGEHAEHMMASCHVVVSHTVHPSALAVRFNGRVLDPAQVVTSVPPFPEPSYAERPGEERAVVVGVPVESIRDGLNRIVVRNDDDKPFEIVGVELAVTPRGSRTRT